MQICDCIYIYIQFMAKLVKVCGFIRCQIHEYVCMSAGCICVRACVCACVCVCVLLLLLLLLLFQYVCACILNDKFSCSFDFLNCIIVEGKFVDYHPFVFIN